MKRSLLVVGDALLDRDVHGRVERLSPERPVPVLDHESVDVRAGGAGLAATMLARDGHEVVLATAIGRDDAGLELAELLADEGVIVVDAGLDGSTPEKIRLLSGSNLLCRLDRGGGTPRRPPARLEALVRRADAVLVSDYGRGLTTDEAVRAALGGARRLVWDPHPRGTQPVAGATLATPNEAEARALAGAGEPPVLAERLLEDWRAAAVCVTCGERGAVVAQNGLPTVTVPVDPVHGDACGAGDRFAATAVGLVAADVPAVDCVAVASEEARAFVAHGARSPGWELEAEGDAAAVIARVRARRGVVVATAGCFDLVHAGHVAMLQAARRLGDCLVVCLNSDASVRRLKGSDRPIVGEDDRAALLRALACVDAVALFDEDTPEAVLERLAPDVFVKGADYAAEELPEAAVMRRLGGRVITVPYVGGHSTTRLVERAAARG